jgi:hypothetical protein
MTEQRTAIYPAAAVDDVRDRLMDVNPHLPEDEAAEIALDIVIDGTRAVERIQVSDARIAALERGVGRIAYRLGLAVGTDERSVQAILDHIDALKGEPVAARCRHYGGTASCSIGCP